VKPTETAVTFNLYLNLHVIKQLLIFAYAMILIKVEDIITT